VQHFLGRVSSNQENAQRHYRHIYYTEFQSNRTIRVESTNVKNIYAPKVRFPLSINVPVHLLHEILSKSDIKHTKYELNIIYVRKYSTAITKPPHKTHPCSTTSTWHLNRFQSKPKNVENWATFHERVPFTIPIFHDTQILINVVMCRSPIPNFIQIRQSV
jgi:hypothetical protein